MRENIEELLNEPLDESVVKRRTQGGTSVDYVEGWYAIETANKVFGFDGWAYETLDLKQVQEEHKKNDKGTEQWYVGYTCRVRVTALGVVRDGMGAGSGISKDLFSAHESAVKEAETDALKRALKSFGYRFGLALYDKAKANVSKNGKKGAKIADQNHVDEKAQKAFVKLGGKESDFKAWVDSIGDKRKAYGAIAKATETGMSLDDALGSLQ